MDFKQFHKKTVLQVNKEIKKLLGEWRSDSGKISPKLLSLIDKFIISCQGGKGIRGMLVVLGYEIGKKSSVVSRQSSEKKQEKSLTAERSDLHIGPILKTDSSIFQIAAAYEIFHSAILVHDDIIDKSTKRRGKDSLYQALGGNHYGISQAICLGDAGFFLATKAISETNFPDKVKIRALNWFYQTMLDTALGQMLDIDKGNPETVAKLKTARYSMSGPLVLGAILAGANPTSPRLRGIEKFGESLGIAFQIKDDISDSESMVWGGMDRAKQTAEKYTTQALKVLPRITKDEDMSKILQQLVEYLVSRKK